MRAAEFWYFNTYFRAQTLTLGELSSMKIYPRGATCDMFGHLKFVFLLLGGLGLSESRGCEGASRRAPRKPIELKRGSRTVSCMCTNCDSSLEEQSVKSFPRDCHWSMDGSSQYMKQGSGEPQIEVKLCPLCAAP